MRDPERIPKVLEELEYYWKQYPDMRLCQLIYCITDGKDIFNIEDDKLIELLKQFNSKKFKENLERASRIVDSWPEWKRNAYGG